VASGAPSERSQQLARAGGAGAVTIDLDEITATAPPRETLEFRSAAIRTIAHEEERDDEGNVTTAAALELEFVGPALIAQLGDQLHVQGGKAYRTKLPPEFAIQVLEAALDEARMVYESMREKPLKSSIPIASSMADVAAAADAAAAVEQDLKGGVG
jgi:hypothetical protein